jgi:RimJ/RimL family protein N-acetyltransferase
MRWSGAIDWPTVAGMAIAQDWLPVTPLAGARLRLEPLGVEHAEEMAQVLDNPQLHTFTGGQPATIAELRSRYAQQIVGHSPDRSQRWLNWVARRNDDAQVVGFIQPTLSCQDQQPYAEVAWVIGTAYQRRGYAQEAAQLMLDWLRDNRVDTLVAHIHPDHDSSNAVARRLGLTPTGDLVDGEVQWR